MKRRDVPKRPRYARVRARGVTDTYIRRGIVAMMGLLGIAAFLTVTGQLVRLMLVEHDYYEGKARAAANNRAISSDDPDAAQKLQEKLAALEKSQARMKTINAYYRKHQTCRGCEGVTEEEAARLDQRVKDGYSWETAPYPPFALSNNNQEIHRIKKRLETLTQNREIGFQGWEFDGGKVVANDDTNRLQIFFDEIPPAEVREALKGHGFRWARSEGAWQRQLSSNAIYAARHIAAIRPIDGSDPIKIQPKRKPQEHER